jgi:hypothetical protein
MSPGLDDESGCEPQEDEIDLEAFAEAFIDLECAVDEPETGSYLMRLYVADDHCGDFPFVIHDGPPAK